MKNELDEHELLDDELLQDDEHEEEEDDEDEQELLQDDDEQLEDEQDDEDELVLDTETANPTLDAADPLLKYVVISDAIALISELVIVSVKVFTTAGTLFPQVMPLAPIIMFVAQNL